MGSNPTYSAMGLAMETSVILLCIGKIKVDTIKNESF